MSSLLDFIWRFLVYFTAIGFFTSAVGIVVSLVLAKHNPHSIKWFWRVLFAQNTLMLVGGILFLLFSKNGGNVDCFENFIRTTGSTPITRGLSLAWIIGFSGWAIFDLVQFIRALKISRNWEKVEASEVLELAAELKAQLKIQKPVSILSTRCNMSPFVFGFLKPKLVISKTLLQSAKPLRSVLAHELVHIKDHDSIWALTEHILRRVLFFMPLQIWAKQIYEDRQEKSADIKAIELARISRSDYAHSFMQVIESCLSAKTLFSASSATSNYRALASRIQFIQSYKKEKSHLPRLFLGFSFLLSSFWCLAEARSSLNLTKANSDEVKMCLQAKHEQAIERILHIEPEPLQCK